MKPTFLEQFVRYKDSQETAVVCGDASLTYAQLYGRSASLASKLRAFGIGVGSTSPQRYDIFAPEEAEHPPWTVIIASRGADAIIGVVATFMAGGAFVLMDPNVPKAYIDGVLEDTAATAVLRDGDFYAGESESFTYFLPKENEIACAIFTSGSTGKPKGAVLEHRVINEMLAWQTEYMAPDGWSATAAYAPFSFIAAIWEIFFPLASGLTLHIPNDDTRRDLFALESYIEKNHISYMFLPPNVAETFTKTYTGKSLKYLRVAGGRLNSCGDPGGRYEILYSLGMAENGGSVTFMPIREAMDGDIPIGQAWNQTRIDLDEETGEMIVSGPSLFRGYMSRRDETEKKLIKNPYSDDPGYETAYLSGDLARVDKNGGLVHMGRKDWIVKIRDMKVDPMQVESALGKCPGVLECCVTAQLIGGETALIGWIAGDAEPEVIRLKLKLQLPEYMIPSVLVSLEKLPRGANGKIDRKTLIYTPAKAGSTNESPASSTPREPLSGIQNAEAASEKTRKDTAESDNVPPETRMLIQAWEDALGVKSLSPDDDFFEVGGTSLTAMRIAAALHENGWLLSTADIFQNPRLGDMAGFMFPADDIDWEDEE